MDIKKARVAVFKSTGSGFETIWGDHFEGHEGYTRLSEYTEVSFVPRKREEVVTEEVAKLDLMKEAVTTEFAQKLAAIAQRRSNLLALSLDSPSD